MSTERKISRREFLKKAGLGLLALGTASCGLDNLSEDISSSAEKADPTSTETPKPNNTSTSTVTPTKTSTQTLTPTETTIEAKDLTSENSEQNSILSLEGYSLNDYLSLITKEDKEFLRRHVIIKGDTSRPVVMLTYDDGGKEENIRQILEALNLYNAKATFFITGEWLERHPDIVREIVAKGLDLGCHGWNHDELTSLGRQGVYEQLRHFLEVSWGILPGYQVRFFRPPYGSRNDMVVDVASCLGMQTVIWSLESGGLDGVEKTVSRVVKGARNGDIVLSHSTRYYDVLAVEKIIKGLIERGLNPVVMKEGIDPKDLWVPSWEINVSLPN